MLPFEENLRPELKTALSELFQIINPTAIQKQSITALLSNESNNQNLIIQAATGSGKTLAFLLPIIQQIAWPSSSQTKENAPAAFRSQKTCAFILAPTKELAQQIFTVLDKICRACCNWIVAGLLAGMDKRKSEKARIRKGLNVVVATPGRLLDHLENTKAFSLDNLEWFVLDEADRLLDLGFGKKIAKILEVCTKTTKKSLRYVCCSATVDEKIDTFFSSVLMKSSSSCGFSVVKASSSSSEKECLSSSNTNNSKLIQKCIILPVKIRLLVLICLVKKYLLSKSSFKAICFFSCCDSVDFHYSLFQEGGFFQEEEKSCGGISHSSKEAQTNSSNLRLFKLHGSLEQRTRSQVYADFTKTERGLLLCTDVAARGLDFPAISLIVQYDAPTEATDYIHRVGRTARMGAQGEAILFLDPSEERYLTLLEEVAKDGLKNVQKLNYQRILQHWNPNVSLQKCIAQLDGKIVAKVQELSLEQAAKTAFSSTVRAYASHCKVEKEIFSISTLHLGHLAKSFGLLATPAGISKEVVRQKRAKNSQDLHSKSRSCLKKQRVKIGEFDSGL